MNNLVYIILIIASGGLFFTYINPKYSGMTGSRDFSGKSIKELRDDQVQYLTALTKTKEISEIQNGLIAKSNSISRENRERSLKLLPDHVDTVRLIIDIKRIVDRHSMVLKDISITGIEKKEGESVSGFGPSDLKYASIDVNFTVTGSYEQFLSFLGDLENSLRILDITSLNFSGATAQYSFTFSARTYYLK